MKTKLFLTALFSVAVFTLVQAQQQNSTNSTTKNTTRTFVDANNDGVCDNYYGTSKKRNQQNLKANQNNGNKSGSGQANKKGQGQRKGANFIDTNANGICDNRE